MRKTSFEYHIHGYRYAPESFHIYKGLPGQEKTELPLSDEQRYQMGYLYLTQGIKLSLIHILLLQKRTALPAASSRSWWRRLTGKRSNQEFGMEWSLKKGW